MWKQVGAFNPEKDLVLEDLLRDCEIFVHCELYNPSYRSVYFPTTFATFRDKTDGRGDVSRLMSQYISGEKIISLDQT